jgi:hypothetical protein
VESKNTGLLSKGSQSGTIKKSPKKWNSKTK